MKQSHRQHHQEKKHIPSLGHQPPSGTEGCFPSRPPKRHGSRKQALSHGGLSVIHGTGGPIGIGPNFGNLLRLRLHETQRCPL